MRSVSYHVIDLLRGGRFESIVCSHSLLTSSRIKGVNCVECKLLHCDYRASRGVDYQTMPLQCIMFFGSQHAI